MARRSPTFHSKTMRESGEEEDAGGIKRQLGARGGGKGAEGKDTEWAEGR